MATVAAAAPPPAAVNKLPAAHNCSDRDPSIYNKVDPSTPRTDPFKRLNKIAENRSKEQKDHEQEVKPVTPVGRLHTIQDEAAAEEELRQLEDEEEYQRQLQLRVESAKCAGEVYGVPKLDLNEVS